MRSPLRIASAQVDLNPHQIAAALFALRSPLSKGALLADEVGLGKTIEAGLVLPQLRAKLEELVYRAQLCHLRNAASSPPGAVRLRVDTDLERQVVLRPSPRRP